MTARRTDSPCRSGCHRPGGRGRRTVGAGGFADGVRLGGGDGEAPGTRSAAGQPRRSLDGRGWLLTAFAEAVLLGLAGFLWVGGFVAAPGFPSPTNEGTLAGVWALHLTAAALCLLVPALLVRRTGVRSWWLAGAVPAAGVIGTAVAISAGW